MWSSWSDGLFLGCKGGKGQFIAEVYASLLGSEKV